MLEKVHGKLREKLMLEKLPGKLHEKLILDKCLRKCVKTNVRKSA